MVGEGTDPECLRQEIASLEIRLRDAEAALRRKTTAGDEEDEEAAAAARSLPTSHHALLLLSDSALPLGTFAFSCGLESYLVHARQKPDLDRFLGLSLRSLAAAALPYVLAAYRCPARLGRLDLDYDASLLCAVARRASVAQGRALLGVWGRAFAGVSWRGGGGGDGGAAAAAAEVLDSFRARLRASPPLPDTPSAHYPPLWGAVSRAMSLSLPQTAHLFLFNHIKALLSAAVRASVMGPYQAHAVLAAEWIQAVIWEAVRRVWKVEVEDAGQVVPVLDLYQGRHELLYSRIFNS
ncbi:MAG: hypothetical protein M1840_006260 [Geoglossum simile]|nr:MAG: hypothetical protein M1840_006260 [Geoglossum simile]